jgi:hypothetical protein
MTVEGFDLAINELLSAQPFRISTVELKGGKLHELDFPEAVFVRQGIAVFTSPGGVKIVFDADSVLQVIVAPAEDAAR